MDHINAAQPGGPPLLHWLGGAALPITVEQLTIGILHHPQAGAGGVLGDCVLAPNTLNEYARLRDALAALALMPFSSLTRFVLWGRGQSVPLNSVGYWELGKNTGMHGIP